MSSEQSEGERPSEAKRDSGGSTSSQQQQQQQQKQGAQQQQQQQQQAADDFNAGAIFGRGLVSCIVPMVNAIDSSVDGVRTAQVELSRQLQTLSENLRRTQDSEARGPDLDAYARRLANCRRRLMITGTLVNNVQSRMTRLQAQSRKLADIAQQQQARSASSSTASTAAATGALTVSS